METSQGDIEVRSGGDCFQSLEVDGGDEEFELFRAF